VVRNVFFSFHYKDVWRVNQVRNCWVTKDDTQAAGYIDAAEFEKVKKQGGDAAVRKWIDKQLEGTSVTVVCIGSETCNREMVRYEIEQSLARGNGIIGVYIHNLKDQDGNTCPKGDLDFGKVDGEHEFSDLFPVYDWVEDNGYDNIGDWVEAAAIVAGREKLGPPSPRYGSPHRCGRS
jgi:hypothetical protein